MYKIVFWHAGVEIDSASIENKPLGGTESAMISVARELSALGHDVKIYSNVKEAHVVGGVQYRPIALSESEINVSPPDVLFVLRNLLPVIALKSRFRVYFSPDAYDRPFVNSSVVLRVSTEDLSFDVGLYSLSFMQQLYDAVFCVGHWQAKTFMERFHIPQSKIFVAGNGVDLGQFSALKPISSRNKSIVYASTPFRGLEYLLKYFPKIREKVPTATCEVFSGMQLYGQSDAEDNLAYGNIYSLAYQPGVNFHGPVAKPKLAEAMSSCRLMAYPNTFAETFCMAALEAQAAGLPIVTTSLAGLKERVVDGENGYLIPGLPGFNDYEEKFIDSVVRLLSDDVLCESMGKKSRMEAEKWDYAKVAMQWICWLDKQSIKERSYSVPDFDPVGEKTTALVGGYPRQVEISKKGISAQLAATLSSIGLIKAAEKMVL